MIALLETNVFTNINFLMVKSLRENHRELCVRNGDSSFNLIQPLSNLLMMMTMTTRIHGLRLFVPYYLLLFYWIRMKIPLSFPIVFNVENIWIKFSFVCSSFTVSASVMLIGVKIFNINILLQVTRWIWNDI